MNPSNSALNSACVPPHRVLNLPEHGFTIEQLRTNYKLLARQLHPDKRPPGMTSEVANQAFQLITGAYRDLLERMQAQESETVGFLGLKANATEAAKQAKAEADARAKAASKRFNAKKFNRLFEDNRVADPVTDYGYGAWMEQTRPGEERVDRELMQVTQVRDLQPMTLGRAVASVPCTELGVIAVKDYSGGSSTGAQDKRNAIVFTDYRLAHSTRSLTDESTAAAAAAAEGRPEMASVDALRRHRAQSFGAPTEDDAREDAEYELARKREERQRLENLRMHDGLMTATHERLSRLMLA